MSNGADEKKNIIEVVDDDSNSVWELYLQDNVRKKYDIIEKLYIEEINKFEKLYNIKNTDKLIFPLDRAKKVYEYISNKIKNNENKKKEIELLKSKNERLQKNNEENKEIFKKLQSRDEVEKLKKDLELVDILEEFRVALYKSYENMFFDTNWKNNYEKMYRTLLINLLESKETENYQAVQELINLMKGYIADLSSINYNVIEEDKKNLSMLYKTMNPQNVIDLCFDNICIEDYKIDEKYVNRNDAFSILYIINKIGFKKISNYKNVYIDEVQDYNDMEIYYFKLEENSKINLFGDYKQNISNNSIPRESWKKLIKFLDIDFKYYELNENYRNTVQNVEYCNKVLDLKM